MNVLRCLTETYRVLAALDDSLHPEVIQVFARLPQGVDDSDPFRKVLACGNVSFDHEVPTVSVHLGLGVGPKVPNAGPARLVGAVGG